jgi:hypothetical protein
MGKGKGLDWFAVHLSGVECAVSASRWPRATVPSTSGRSERPSAKKELGRKRDVLGLILHVLAAAGEQGGEEKQNETGRR